MDEITLESGVPLEVVPRNTITVYNNMGADDPLFVSSHGDVNRKWLKVEGGDYLKFAASTWLMHKNLGERIFPCYETL